MDRKEWRNQVVEPALEPELPIVDSHHHLWEQPPAEQFEPYPSEALIADRTASGHNVIATVYVDSHANYRTGGPKALRVVGETEFADKVAEECSRRGGAAAGGCAGIVSHVDLALGRAAGEILDAHIAASRRFRGIRHMTAFDFDLPPIYGATEPGLMTLPAFREGFAELVSRGLSFDAWLFQSQLAELKDLAQSFPEANIVLDHVGGPLSIGRYANRRSEAFVEWRRQMAALAQHPNIIVKLGALNMPQTGMDATDASRPHSSEKTALLQRDHILTTIDLFGPERCMFESNFPVDMLSISYNLLWNSFKQITEDFSASDRTQLFSGTAIRVYRLEELQTTGPA